MASTIQRWEFMTTLTRERPAASADFAGVDGLEQVPAVAAIMVGIESRKLNSSAAGPIEPTIWPAAMVDMERDVPGKIAESDWQMPIQMAWPRVISSTWVVLGS